MGQRILHLPTPFFQGGDIFFLTLPEVNDLVGWFTKKNYHITPPKGKTWEPPKYPNKAPSCWGFQPLTLGVFWFPRRGGFNSSYPEDCSGWRFSSWSWTSCQRCSEGYSRGKPRNKPQGCRKGMGLMGDDFWGWSWGFLGILIGVGGLLVSSRLVVGVQRF